MRQMDRQMDRQTSVYSNDVLCISCAILMVSKVILSNENIKFHVFLFPQNFLKPSFDIFAEIHQKTMLKIHVAV